MKYGFEVEIEDITKHPKIIPGINETSDNSLRNGKEFVSSVLPDKDFACLLYEYLQNNLEGNYSERCGLHFHMNVGDKDRDECMSFLKRYLMIERTLFRVKSDILRSNNNFCNLVSDSHEELNIIRNFNKQGVEPHEYSKYIALNIKPMLTINTFEFRALKAGISTEDFHEMLNIFEQLWDNNAPLPFEEQISEKDRKEAEAIIKLIDTEPESESSNTEFMDHHFRDTDDSTHLLISEDSIRAYLNSMGQASH